MPLLDLFHGADSEKMLYNIEHLGLTTDSTGKLYFAQYQWTNCLVHGAVPDPPAVQIDRSPRSGNPDALIVCATPELLIRCEFLEMYVRQGNREDGFHTKIIPGPQIEAYLRGI